ncbi:hypothetical protein [Roseibium sp.]|uniref:hypothetical protein n=1 Tax=Roseibium sp. TaxID=1936156 RepID=UPI003B529391
MPVGKIFSEGTKAAAKEGAKKLINELIGLAINEALKAEAYGISKALADTEISRDMRRRQLTKKGKELQKAFGKHADAAVTGLSYSLAVANVFGEANRYPMLPADDLLDTLKGMLGTIDTAVDREYQKYLTKINESGPPAKAGNVIHLVAGVPESWANSVDWKPIYKKLQADLRARLQKLENARVKRIEVQKGRNALKDQIQFKLVNALADLRIMIGKFVQMDRDADIVEGWRAESQRKWKINLKKLNQGTEQHRKFHEKGIVFWEGEVYRKKDHKKFVSVLRSYVTKENKTHKTYNQYNTQHEALAKKADAFEKRLFNKLAQIRDLHWQLWKVRSELKLKTGKEPIRALKLPPVDVPWRLKTGYVKLRSDTYPFDTAVPGN